MTKQEFIDKYFKDDAGNIMANVKGKARMYADLEKLIAWEQSIWKKACDNLYKGEPLSK